MGANNIFLLFFFSCLMADNTSFCIIFSLTIFTFIYFPYTTIWTLFCRPHILTPFPLHLLSLSPKKCSISKRQGQPEQAYLFYFHFCFITLLASTSAGDAMSYLANHWFSFAKPTDILLFPCRSCLYLPAMTNIAQLIQLKRIYIIGNSCYNRN